MLTIDKISDSAIRLDYGVTPTETHAVYRARVEKGILILSPLSGPGKTFAAPFRTVRVNGQTFDTPENLLDALSFIGNFNAGGGTSQTTLPPFEAGKFYAQNQAIVKDGVLYTAKTGFTASGAFDPGDWNRIGVAPSDLAGKLDKTADADKIYGTDENGDQTAYGLSLFERSANKTDMILDADQADDEHYPSELAVRTALDELADDLAGNTGDLSAITAATDKSTLVAALNSLFRMAESTFGILVEIKSGGLYITRDDGATVTEMRLAELSDLEPLAQEIQGLHGKTARLNGYDFGMGITSENIGDPDIRIMLTAYALVQLGFSGESQIPNFIGVHNLYGGDGGNHLLIFNQAITGSGTPESPEFPAHWVDNGLDSVSMASNTSLGVVKGSAADMKVAVAPDGTMDVNGLGTALAGKLDKTAGADKIYGTDENGDQTAYGKDTFGQVDTVNGIPPDANKNVQTDYVYATEAEFEADKANIPVGATVIKLYEYPDSTAGFMVVPDYANRETANRIVDTNNGTWVADRTGFVFAGGFATSGGSSLNQVEIDVLVNNKSVFYTNTMIAASKHLNTHQTFPVLKDDVVRILINNTGGGTLSAIQTWCYFMPPKFVKKELPVVVEKNGSYSLDEVKTADTWLDGKPIYKKTYQKTYTALGKDWEDYPSIYLDKLIKTEVTYSGANVAGTPWNAA